MRSERAAQVVLMTVSSEQASELKVDAKGTFCKHDAFVCSRTNCRTSRAFRSPAVLAKSIRVIFVPSCAE